MQQNLHILNKSEIIKVLSVYHDGVKTAAHTNGNKFSGNLSILFRYNYQDTKFKMYNGVYENFIFIDGKGVFINSFGST